MHATFPYRGQRYSIVLFTPAGTPDPRTNEDLIRLGFRPSTLPPYRRPIWSPPRICALQTQGIRHYFAAPEGSMESFTILQSLLGEHVSRVLETLPSPLATFQG